MGRKFDLEERLIEFAIVCIKQTKTIERTYTGEHLTKQLIRSTTGAALNYGEVQAAESKRDFVHKLAIVLKELKESRVNLKIQQGISRISDNSETENNINECEELIAIVAKSLQTARSRTKYKKN